LQHERSQHKRRWIHRASSLLGPFSPVPMQARAARGRTMYTLATAIDAAAGSPRRLSAMARRRHARSAPSMLPSVVRRCGARCHGQETRPHSLHATHRHTHPSCRCLRRHHHRLRAHRRRHHRLRACRRSAHRPCPHRHACRCRYTRRSGRHRLLGGRHRQTPARPASPTNLTATYHVR
jgi:hypothetical protein